MSDREQDAPTLEELRAQIDAVDHEILKLLAERMGVVAKVADVKRTTGAGIRDFKREREILADRRAVAAELGLPQGEVESIYRMIMVASRDYQASLRAALPRDVEPRRVLIVGGAGAMGRLLQRLFGELGHEVSILDRDTVDRVDAEVPAADVVVISVPIEVSEEVIRRVGPHMRADALLMDVTSIKQAPLRAMLEATSASVLGTHPMFGPGVHSLQGQRIVVCPGRGDAWRRWVEQMFSARGLVVEEASPEVHDRAMAVVQVLTHFQTQVLGWALARIGVPLSESRRFTSPAYLMELYIAARHFAQAPELYGPIEMRNPMTSDATQAFREAAEELSDILETRDQQRFTAMFEEVRRFFGDFTDEALEQSSFLIDRLVERS